jgi:hypothetical protein
VINTNLPTIVPPPATFADGHGLDHGGMATIMDGAEAVDITTAGAAIVTTGRLTFAPSAVVDPLPGRKRIE